MPKQKEYYTNEWPRLQCKVGDKVVYNTPNAITQYGVVIDIVQHLIMIQMDSGKMVTLMNNNPALQKTK